MKNIIGAGGGGKGGGSAGFVAKEESDSLRSIAYAQIIDLVSEGPIGGLVNGPNSVYLDETPVIDDNGNENFKGVQIVTREGTQAQDIIEGFPSSENEVIVGVLVTHATPIVRTVTDSLVDAIRLTISFPILTKTNSSTGDVGGTEVQFKIEVNSNGAGYAQVANDTIIGKTTSKYQKSYRIELPGTGPHQVRLSRVTADADSAAIQDKLYWDSYTEIVDAKLKYPNSALVAIRVDAANFRSIPNRAYHLKLLQIKIPSNYDPLSRVYSTDIWDGTFTVAWSNNPAWVLYDLLINSRYGCGMAEADIDKWGLYEIGQFCDELIDDGFGSKEPRFTVNCYFQQRAEAFNLIKDLCTVFRGISYWQGGILNVTQDAPQEAAFLFHQGNVINGEFTYQGTAKKNRYTVALVTWNDPADFFRPKVEYVPHEEGITRYGIIQSETVAFGCTSRGQAHRMGRWLLYTSQQETEVVNFEAGIDAGKLQLGQIIKVADPMRAGARRGGRVSSSTINTVTTDQDLTLITGVIYTLYVMLPDGSMEERLFTSANYAARVITVGTNFSAAPHAHGLWMISSADIEPQTFRLISISEKDGKYQISTLAHDPAKFDLIENDLIIPERDISSLSIIPDAPAGLAVTENLYNAGGVVKVKATFSWETTANAVSYFVTYRKQNGNVVSLGETSSNEVEVLNVDEGIYDFFVTAVSILGNKSQKSTTQYEVLGKSIAPADVEEFSIMPLGLEAEASWKKSEDLDVLNGGRIELKHSPQAVGVATWANSISLGFFPGSSTKQKVALMNGTYLAKFLDSSGNYSETAVLIFTDILESQQLNVVATLTEHPNFTGTKTNMAVSSQYSGLVLTGSTLIDDIEDFDAISAVDFAGGVATEGTYEFSSKVDLTEVYTSKVIVAVDVEAVDVTDEIDQRLDEMDTWTDFDGSNLTTVNAEIFMATTNDDPASGGATWSGWKRFFVGEYTARGFKFKLVAKSSATNHSIIIKSLVVTVDMPDRSVQANGLTSSALGTTITYEKGFKALPAISITAKNMNTGDYYRITSELVTGFTIRFFDSTGTGIARNYDYIAKGYGRQNP